MTAFTKSSPNTMVMEYWQLLSDLVYPEHPKTDPNDIRRQVALTVLLSVTAVETFVNIYFRLLVSQDAFKNYERRIINDLKHRISLEEKLVKWPKLLFGREFDQSKGIGQEFKELKDLRNKLMHFTTSHETLKIGEIEIHGLSDISFYHKLTTEDSLRAETVAHRTMAEVIRLSGKSEEEVKAEMLRYTGWPAA